MGLFDMLRSMFPKKPDSSRPKGQPIFRPVLPLAPGPAPPKPGEPPMITVYDKFGRQLLIPRQEWQEKVLPGNLEQHKDHPDNLYTAILTALNDGFCQDVLSASERLLAIDNNRERGHVVRAIVLMKNGDLDDAEQVLQQYIQHFGATGSVLTNLAKVYAEHNQHEEAEATLWKGLTLDPNQDNGLLWWAALHQDRSGKEGFLEAIRRVATIEGSWRPQLWLARDCLENKNLAEAKTYYNHILRTAADQPDALMMISGDLGKSGHVREVLDMVLPLYDPEKHDIRAGGNILQAYLETKNYVDGQKFLHRLFALNRPDFRDRLMFYSAEFGKLQDSARQQPQGLEAPVKASAFRLDRPIWGYGLNDPKWLFRPEEKTGKSIVFTALANTSPTGLTVPTAQQASDLGRLTRSIPLYLLESFYYWSDTKPTTVIPVIVGAGPIVSGTNWPVEHICSLAEGVAAIAVTGSIHEENEKLTIRLSVWDCPTKRVLKEFTYITTPPLLGPTILKMETELLEYFDPVSLRAATPRQSFHSRPSPQMVDRYLACLGQTLALTFAQNDIISPTVLWGERNILEACLATALEMESAQVPRILFLASLAKNRAYGSSVYSEFKSRAMTLLEGETDPASVFYRLSPLLFKVFDMHEEFARRKSELQRDVDPLYCEWIDGLSRAAER